MAAIRRLLGKLHSDSGGHALALAALSPRSRPITGGLRALTQAALALPLLAPSVTEGSSLQGASSLNIGHYQEGPRNLDGIISAFEPIQVDLFRVSGGATFSDDLRFDLSFLQDSWSGATPIATAPWELRGNRPTEPDGVSGATPYLEGSLYFDSDFSVLATDGFGNLTGGTDNRLVHTIASASPETRREIDVSVGRALEQGDVRLGGGVSLEPDYTSIFVDLGGSLDFGAQSTSIALDVGYAHSETDAVFDHDASPYIDSSSYSNLISIDAQGNRRLQAGRDDVRLSLGISHLLDRNTSVEASVAYGYATGYLSNPYRVVEVAFIDPNQQGLAPPGGYYGEVHALIERRPGQRHELAIGASITRHIDATQTAVRLGYSFGHDDWGINAHTFDLQMSQPVGLGFLLTPRFRYYSQTAANFYDNYLISDQAFRTVSIVGGQVVITPWNPDLLPTYYSSDPRLSAFGSLGGGVTLSRYLGKGVSLEAGFDYFAHAGDFKLGGGGEGAFTNFDGWTASGALVIDLAALSLAGGAGHGEHGGHSGHIGGFAPAGVMAAHMLNEPGDFMLGYRFATMFSGGEMREGTKIASDATLVAQACPPAGCSTAPRTMTMNRHMFELMFAVTDWLNLMVMPSYVDTEMTLRPLAGGIPDVHSQHLQHSTGGWGDLPFFALVRLLERDQQHLHLGLGFSAPTGSVSEKFRRSHQEDLGYIHYGMQLGSGTWDALPSLTYLGAWKDFSWGAQLGGVIRMQDRNASGYRLGQVARAQGWAGYSILPWLTGTLRGVYSYQGSIEGEYNGPHSTTTPPDFPENYGGHYWDLGVGLRATVPDGLFRGQSFAVEWLQPLATDFNGFQLERTGSLFVTTQLTF